MCDELCVLLKGGLLLVKGSFGARFIVIDVSVVITVIVNLKMAEE